MRMSARRDVQKAGRNARRKQAGRADETVVRVKGEKGGRSVVEDAATGEVLGLDVLVKRDSDGFMDWLRCFVSGYGVEAMAADDLSAYKPVVRRLGVYHQICAAGVEPSRQDIRLGLGQGEDMETADGAAVRRGLGASAS